MYPGADPEVLSHIFSMLIILGNPALVCPEADVKTKLEQKIFAKKARTKGIQA